MHTPTPWKIADDMETMDCIGIYGPKDNPTLVAEIRDPESPEQIPIMRENAAHIVQCVNSHKALVEALESIVTYRDRVGPIHFQLEKMDDFILKARKALTLAKKGAL